MDVQQLLQPVVRDERGPSLEELSARVRHRRRRRRVIQVSVVLAAFAVVLAVVRTDDTSPTKLTTADQAGPSDEEQIRVAIDTLFLPEYTADAKLAQFDEPAGLEETIAAGMSDPRAPGLTLQVVDVEIDGSTATTRIAFSENGASLGVYPLDFVRVGDRWLARRASYCAMLTGLSCPTGG